MEQLVVKGAKDFSKDQFGRTQVTSAEDMANVRYQNFFLIHHCAGSVGCLALKRGHVSYDTLKWFNNYLMI